MRRKCVQMAPFKSESYIILISNKNFFFFIMKIIKKWQRLTTQIVHNEILFMLIFEWTN